MIPHTLLDIVKHYIQNDRFNNTLYFDGVPTDDCGSPEGEGAGCEVRD